MNKDRYSDFEIKVNVIGDMLRNMQKLPGHSRGYEKIV